MKNINEINNNNLEIKEKVILKIEKEIEELTATINYLKAHKYEGVYASYEISKLSVRRSSKRKAVELLRQ